MQKTDLEIFTTDEFSRNQSNITKQFLREHIIAGVLVVLLCGYKRQQIHNQ